MVFFGLQFNNIGLQFHARIITALVVHVVTDRYACRCVFTCAAVSCMVFRRIMLTFHVLYYLAMQDLDQDKRKALKTLVFQWFRFNTSHNTIYRKSTNLRFMHVCIDPAGVVNRNRNGRNWRRAFPFANQANFFAFTE